MTNYANILKHNNINPVNFLEIGSRDGHDSNVFAQFFNISDVYVIEPSPQSFRDISTNYPNFKIFNKAFSYKCGKTLFHNVTEDCPTLRGMSSLMDRDVYSNLKSETLEVEIQDGASFLRENNIHQIDACKIDTEGHSFEVLSGFGDSLTKIKSMHIESETVEVWENQKLYKDIKGFLESNGYSIFYYTEYNHPTTQSDSIWIHKSAL